MTCEELSGVTHIDDQAHVHMRQLRVLLDPEILTSREQKKKTRMFDMKWASIMPLAKFSSLVLYFVKL